MNAKGVDAAATVLGKGSFGHVVRREIGGELVVVKELWPEARSDALQEVAVSAALTPHPCAIQLLDVLAVGKEVHLVYPLWGQALDKFVEQRRARPPHRGSLEESLHIFKSLLSATRHMHTHGLVHTDIKPPKCACEGLRLDRRPQSRRELAELRAAAASAAFGDARLFGGLGQLVGRRSQIQAAGGGCFSCH